MEHVLIVISTYLPTSPCIAHCQALSSRLSINYWSLSLKRVWFFLFLFVYSHSSLRQTCSVFFHCLLSLGITICLVVPAGSSGFKGLDISCKFWCISLRGYRPSCKPFCTSTTGLIPLLGNVHYPLPSLPFSQLDLAPEGFIPAAISASFLTRSVTLFQDPVGNP